MQRGVLIGAAASVSTAGATVTLDPTAELFAGELVEVTATSRIESTTADPVIPQVRQFRARVAAGSGLFDNNGQSLGDHETGAVAVGDLDGDGDLDAFVGGWNNNGARVWLNDGGGAFSDSGQSLGANATRDVSLGDLDGDGDLDAFVPNAGERADLVWLNNGSGLFSDSGQRLGDHFGWGVSLGDLDGDGDLDAFVVNNGIGSSQGNRVWLNNGGVFSDSGQSLGNHASFSISLSDLDGDGDLDAFVANFGTGNKVWINNNGQFSDSGQSLGDHASFAVSLGDLDGDGDLDAFVANSGGAYVQSNRLWVNDGSGLFSDSGQFLGPQPSRDVQLGDLDGDGDLDAFVANYDQNRVWVNSGSGQFSDAGQLLGNHISEGVALGDLDGDGDLDALIANNYRHPNRVWLNRNLDASVTLTVDSTAIPEAAGIATVTATLSAEHGQPVTVKLGLSGTAMDTDDYTASGTQIVIAAGTTIGSVTVTAVDDIIDEPDETVIVDITSISNGQAVGTHQITTTIMDDDEPRVPNVTLAVDNSDIPEAAGVATFSVTLSEPTTVPVTVDLSMTGTAMRTTDYVSSSTQITVTPGTRRVQSPLRPCRTH